MGKWRNGRLLDALKGRRIYTLTCDIVGHIVAIAGRVSVENARDRVRASGALRGRRCGAWWHRRGHRLPAEGDIAAHVIFRVWGGGWGIGRAKQAIVWIITGLVARRFVAVAVVRCIAEQSGAQLRLVVVLHAAGASLFGCRAENVAASATRGFQHPETMEQWRHR